MTKRILEAATDSIEVKRWEWAGGVPSKVDATTAGHELMRIARRDNDVVPLTLVEESQPAEAPLHACFEWDDAAAAEQWREEQARKIIGSIRVVYVQPNGQETPPMRAFVRMSATDLPFDMYELQEPKHYTPILTVMGDSELRDRYVKKALRELGEWRKRYRDIEAFAAIFDVIDQLQSQETEVTAG